LRGKEGCEGSMRRKGVDGCKVDGIGTTREKYEKD
jgi:hypothetical protein